MLVSLLKEEVSYSVVWLILTPVAPNIKPERERAVMGAGETAQRIKLSPHNQEDLSSDLLTHPKLTAEAHRFSLKVPFGRGRQSRGYPKKLQSAILS